MLVNTHRLVFLVISSIILIQSSGFRHSSHLNTRLVRNNYLSSQRQVNNGAVVVRSKMAMCSGEASSTLTPSAPPKSGKDKLWDSYLKTTDTLTTLFPLWTVLFAGLALARPSSFAWFTTKYFTASLG